MQKEVSYISKGDLFDIYHKLRKKGLYFLFKSLRISEQSRVIAKWNSNSESSDFWIIPQVKSRWNLKCSGDPNIGYDDYFIKKYLQKRSGLKMLSVGCGSGAKERRFAHYPVFSSIEGIDLAPLLIDEARKAALHENIQNLYYSCGDFTKIDFEPSSYDVIHFNSSLHHFKNIDHLLREKVLPLLKENGFLVVFEYVGPNRLQWTKAQLDCANSILDRLPGQFKRIDGTTLFKKKIYRPGLIRMKLVDPSEAIDSASIVPCLHRYFNVLEEKHIGWDLTQILLKDIACNFLENNDQTINFLNYIFEQEDKYMADHRSSDGLFGIYQARKNIENQ